MSNKQKVLKQSRNRSNPKIEAVREKSSLKKKNCSWKFPKTSWKTLSMEFLFCWALGLKKNIHWKYFPDNCNRLHLKKWLCDEKFFLCNIQPLDRRTRVHTFFERYFVFVGFKLSSLNSRTKFIKFCTKFWAKETVVLWSKLVQWNCRHFFNDFKADLLSNDSEEILANFTSGSMLLEVSVTCLMKILLFPWNYI